MSISNQITSQITTQITSQLSKITRSFMTTNDAGTSQGNLSSNIVFDGPFEVTYNISVPDVTDSHTYWGRSDTALDFFRSTSATAFTLSNTASGSIALTSPESLANGVNNKVIVKRAVTTNLVSVSVNDGAFSTEVALTGDVVINQFFANNDSNNLITATPSNYRFLNLTTLIPQTYPLNTPKPISGEHIELPLENVFGSEEVINGDFSNGLTGFGTGVNWVSSNGAAFNPGGSNNDRLEQTLSTPSVGGVYLFKVSTSAVSGGGYGYQIRDDNSGGTVLVPTVVINNAEDAIIPFIALSATTYVAVQTLNGSTTMVVDDMSVQSVTNALTLTNVQTEVFTKDQATGDFTSLQQSQDGFASNVNSWREPRGASTLSQSTNRIRSTSDGTATFGLTLKYDNLLVGSIYSYSGRGFRGDSIGTLLVRAGNVSTLGAGLSVDVTFNDPIEIGEFSELFEATATTMYVGLISAGHNSGQFIELESIKLERILEAV